MQWSCRWMLSLTIPMPALDHGFITGPPFDRRAQGSGSDTTQRKGRSWMVYGKMHPDFKALFLRKPPPWCAEATTQPWYFHATKHSYNCKLRCKGVVELALVGVKCHPCDMPWIQNQ